MDVSRSGTNEYLTSRAGERRQVLASKVSAPARRPGIVDRSALIDRLSTMTHVPVVMVSAAAGYGKTTLLALWAERDERPFAWVTLDSADDDPVVLITVLLAALDPVLHLDPAILRRLQAADPPVDDVILPLLANACADTGPFVLVLDDVQQLIEQDAHAVIGFLADHLPPGCQIALATRTDPPLPLASWRAHGRLFELRASDLALGNAEAAGLLAASHVRLTDAQLSRLVDRTEGWCAAIYLAALSLRDRDDPEDFIESFAGTSRHVADFLSEDVLGRLSPDVVEFLLATCLLDELTPSLCDAVIGRDDSDAMLRTLEGSNLFVVPLDEDRHTYRYHQLFAEYLRAELNRRAPDLVPVLHRRAYHWYRDHRLFGRAITHAHACGDATEAASLVAARWMSMYERGEIETMRAWLSSFTDQQIEQHAPLAIAAAWIFGHTGERDRAIHFTEAARRGSWNGTMPDGTASLDSSLAILCAAHAFGGISEMHAAAQRAVDLEPLTSPWRTGALTLLGQAQALEGDLAGARATLEQAHLLTGEKHASGATTLAWLAFIAVQEGDIDHALAQARRAHAIVEQTQMSAHLPTIATYSVLANLLSRQGDLDGAARAVERANDLLPRLTDVYWWQMSQAYTLLATALAALGRESEAGTLLAESRSVLDRHQDIGRLGEWTDQAARGLRRNGRLQPRASDLTDAERRILPLLDSRLTMREIGRELYLSHNTVRTHVHSIYRKLGVTSRQEAVIAARQQRHPLDRVSPG
jgi:LuxR family maltose regulon positive regulatory protein